MSDYQLNDAARSVLFMSDEDEPVGIAVERGVSVDQGRKFNVRAIEPKMEVDTKNNEEKTGSLIVADGGFTAFAAAAVVILTNLLDPDA